MNFTEVLIDVAGMTPANKAMLDLIALQLGVPANPDFTLLQQATMTHLAATPANPAPPTVEALIQAHRLNMATLAGIPGAPAPAPTPPPVPPAQAPAQAGLGGNFLTNGGIWQLLLFLFALAVIIVAAIWSIHELTDDDDGTTVPTSPEATPTTAPSPTPTATQPAVGNDEGDSEGQLPELLRTTPSDKPEPTYSGNHRIPAVDFASSGVLCKKSFDNESAWALCEDGALQTEVGSWRWPEAEVDTFGSNCPEGFFWFGSMGQGKIGTNKPEISVPATIVMQPEKGLNYLVGIRCPLNDAIVDSDRNHTLRISDIVVGHAGWTPVDEIPGKKNPEDAAYMSMEWFGEQLVVSGTKSGTNCGATGCSRTIVVLWDIDSGLHERYLVTNVKGETNDADNDGIEDYGSATWEKIYTNAR